MENTFSLTAAAPANARAIRFVYLQPVFTDIFNFNSVQKKAPLAPTSPPGSKKNELKSVLVKCLILRGCIHALYCSLADIYSVFKGSASSCQTCHQIEAFQTFTTLFLDLFFSIS